VVFEIEDVGDDRDKAFLMGGLLIQITEHLRLAARQSPPAGLRHLSVFEEAHRLLRRTEQPGPAAHAVELFAALLAEIRAYGEGLIVAEQIPSKLVPDVIKNTAVKIMHRLPAADDREAVGATTNLTERQSQFLVTLPPGTAAVFTDGMDQPILVRMPDGTSRERGGVGMPPSAVIGRRSTTCGAACLTSACTLRDMRTAQRLLEDEPWLVLWAELATLGHLTGWPTPAPLAYRLRSLLALPSRLRECALSHAVDQAAHARSSVLAATTDPEALASHVLGSLVDYLDGAVRCAPSELSFLARPYRWARVSDVLSAAPPDGPRHPSSVEWETFYGRPIPGATVREQSGAVHGWLERDLADAAVRRTVALGSPTPSALERALGSSLGSPEWSRRVGEAVDESFVDCAWPMLMLVGRDG
jgi:hypothetical protein